MLKTLQPEDTLQLIMQAKDKDERDFLKCLGFFATEKAKRGY